MYLTKLFVRFLWRISFRGMGEINEAERVSRKWTKFRHLHPVAFYFRFRNKRLYVPLFHLQFLSLKKLIIFCNFSDHSRLSMTINDHHVVTISKITLSFSVNLGMWKMSNNIFFLNFVSMRASDFLQYILNSAVPPSLITLIRIGFLWVIIADEREDNGQLFKMRRYELRWDCV